MENEVWKNIKGYEGLYQVSNLGNVKSLNYRKTGEERLLKPTYYGKLFLGVKLSYCGELKVFKVHRLVAQAFLNNYDDDLEVTHIDGNHNNNQIENLKMRTENERVDFFKKRILCIETGKIYESQRDASKELKLNESSSSSIGRVCKGKRKSAGGYHFKYVN